MTKLSFFGAAQKVTGSKHLVTTSSGKNILLDCGLFYGEEKKVFDDFEFMYTDSGHILGSAAININLKDGNKVVRLFFSGDIGRYNDLILRAPQPFPQTDYIICESTYGNRLHDTPGDA